MPIAEGDRHLAGVIQNQIELTLEERDVFRIPPAVELVSRREVRITLCRDERCDLSDGSAIVRLNEPTLEQRLGNDMVVDVTQGFLNICQ